MVLRLSTWSRIKGTPLAPPSLATHINYISCMKDLSDGLKLQINFNIKSKSKNNISLFDKKLRLIYLIKNSLDEEYLKAKEDSGFAKICSVWVAVKSYYLIFNMLLVLRVLINDEKCDLKSSHAGIIAMFRGLLKNKKITFNKEEFNLVSSCGNALSFTSANGDTLRYNVDDTTRAKSMLKKICMYKFEDFSRSQNIKSFRSAENKKKKQNFLENTDISLFELFYWYRIKTNYRDLSFIDHEESDEQIAKFYNSYYFLTLNFYNALKEIINTVSIKRFGKEVI